MKCFSESEELILPEQISALEQKCFANCDNLKKIRLSRNVSEISCYAFEDSYINEISFDNGNSCFDFINGFLLNKNSGVLLKCFDNVKETLEIPSGTISIGSLAFSECKNVKTVVFPESLEIITFGSFTDCENLERIIFRSNKIRIIQDGAFVGCVNLKNIEFHKKGDYFIEDRCLKDKYGNLLLFLGKVECEEYAVPECRYIYPFAYADKLCVNRLILSDKIERVGSFAFKDCCIKEIFAGKSLKDIGEESFAIKDICEVTLSADTVPEVWKNSFPEASVIYVPKLMADGYFADRDWRKYNLNTRLCSKPKEQVCGSACLEYLLGEKSEKLCWMPEMAYYVLTKQGYSSSLLCYESNLYEDYKTGNLKEPALLEMFEKYISLGGTVDERKTGITEFKEFLTQGYRIIVNVRSDILFEDESLRGNNHYIILENADKDGITTVLPGKENIYKRRISSHKFTEMISGNGNWVLLIKGDNNEKNRNRI